MRTITLNIIKGYGLTPVLNVSQFDKGYTVTATVQKGAEAFTPPAGSTATVEGRKPDNTGYQYPATIDGSTVTFTMAEQMTVLSGRSMAEIVFYDADAVRIGTANFYLLVEEAPLNDNTVISETDLPTIQQALDLLKNGALAPGIIGTASGDVAAFSDGARDTALSSLAVNIAPVQSGSGDPSPSNIRPISGWQTVNVTRAGKNILPVTAETVTRSGITFTVNEDGSVSISGTATAAVLLDVCESITFKKGVQYTITGCPAGGGIATTNYWLSCYAVSASTVIVETRDSGSGATFSFAEDTTLRVRIRIPNGNSTPLTFYPMIRVASITDATFEPYAGETYPVTLPTEAGTVYGGTLDIVTGKLIVDKAYTLITSALRYDSSGKALNLGALPQSAAEVSVFKIADYAASIMRPVVNVNAVRDDANDNVFTVLGRTVWGKSSAWASVADANAFLSTNPMQIVYKLATPLEYDLTPKEVTTLLGSNNIYADCGDVENAEYLIDIKEYVDSQIDDTLTVSGAAADAKVTGEKVAEVKNDLTLFKGGKYELLKGNFVNGSLTAGNLVPVAKYRVAETEIISYDRDITLNIASGYKVGVQIFINGSFSSDSGWKTGTYYIAAGTTFKIVIAKTTEDTSSTADVLAFRSAVTSTSVIDDITKKAEQHAWTIDDIKNVLTWQVGGLLPSGEIYNPQTWRLRTTLSVVPYDITITKENGFQFRIITFDDASMTNPVQSDWYVIDGATFDISAGTYFKILALWTRHDSITYAIDDIATSFVFNAVHIYKTGGAYLTNQKKIDAIKTFNPCFASVSHQGYSTTGQAFGHNKISSYIGSFKHGFDTAETDIQFSSDGVPVCCHDASFVDSNDSSITVVIADHTVAELKTYGYYGETIATLAEVVETCKMYGLKLELDKVSSTWTEANWTSVFNVISTYQMQDHVIWTCPYNSNAIVNRILAYNPKAKIMINISGDISLLDQYIAWLPAVMTDTSEFIFAVNYSIMTVEQLKGYNLQLPKRTNILVWTIDDSSVYRDYMPYAWGITSNKLCAKDIMF